MSYGAKATANTSRSTRSNNYFDTILKNSNSRARTQHQQQAKPTCWWQWRACGARPVGGCNTMPATIRLPFYAIANTKGRKRERSVAGTAHCGHSPEPLEPTNSATRSVANRSWSAFTTFLLLLRRLSLRRSSAETTATPTTS